MEAFGIIFTRDIKIYLYPFKSKNNNEILNSKNIPIHPRIKALYNYLYTNKRIIDLEYNYDVLNIFSRDVLDKIKNYSKGYTLEPLIC